MYLEYSALTLYIQMPFKYKKLKSVYKIMLVNIQTAISVNYFSLLFDSWQCSYF